MSPSSLRRACISLIACLVAVYAAPARAQTGPASAEVVGEAYALVQNKRPKEALGKLTPLVPQHAGDADFHAVHGMALLDSGARRRQRPRSGAR